MAIRMVFKIICQCGTESEHRALLNDHQKEYNIKTW